MLQWADYRQDGHNKQMVVFGHRRCDCGCGTHLGTHMRQVLAIMDTKVIWVSDGPRGSPHLSMPYANYNIMYRKAVNLPKEKKEHITTQFLMRGFAEWKERHIPERDIEKIMTCLQKEKVYNLSDQHVPGTDHFRGSLREKLDLIASAKMHITLDSGTAHLASMTNTPMIVIARRRYWNRYEMQSNAFCIPNAEEALPVIADICLGRININKCKLL